MTILATDLKLFAAAYPLDVAYGGGLMINGVVQDGIENNIFPDIDAAARSAGRVQMRKVFAAAVSANADALMGAQIGMKVPPADAAVNVVAFAFGDQTTLRADAAAALLTSPYNLQATYLGAAGVFNGSNVSSFISSPPLGSLVAITVTGTANVLAVGVVTAVSGSGPYNVTVAFRYVLSAGTTIVGDAYVVLPTTGGGKARTCGAAKTTAAAAAGATTIAVGAVEAQVVPSAVPYPAVVNGLDMSADGLRRFNGRAPIFRPGEQVLIRSATLSEFVTVLSVDYRGGLTFTTGLVNAYASGSVVSSLLALGDMQATIGASFSQQTWTKVFSDTLIGNPIAANYNRSAAAITTTNLGGATERWAIVFTSATDFKLIGEVVGQIAVGNIATAFSPTNPITGAPFFTIPTAGWGTGWATGYVLRFNTVGSRAPFWVSRTISISAPGGLDGSTLELRGTVNA